MKLSDLRRIAIRQQARLRFPLPGGMECLINEHGIAKVPGLKGKPAFDIEGELVQAQQFQWEPVASPSASRVLSRDELRKMTAGSPDAGAAQDHDE